HGPDFRSAVRILLYESTCHRIDPCSSGFILGRMEARPHPAQKTMAHVRHFSIYPAYDRTCMDAMAGFVHQISRHDRSSIELRYGRCEKPMVFANAVFWCIFSTSMECFSEQKAISR